MKHGTHMPQEDWSDYAKEIGPDPRQPEMVSRAKVLGLLLDEVHALDERDTVFQVLVRLSRKVKAL